MKKFLAVMLSIVMVASCFIGCKKEDSKKTNPDVKGDIIVDESEAAAILAGNFVSTVDKLKNGFELQETVEIAMTPIEGADYDNENLLITKKDDGSYSMKVTLIGTANESGGKIVLKANDIEVTDYIFDTEGNAYINMKTLFDFMCKVAQAEQTWPLDKEYISLEEIMGDVSKEDALAMLEDIYGNVDFGSMDGMMDMMLQSMDEESQAYMDLISDIALEIISNTEVQEFCAKVATAMLTSQLLSVTENSISVRLDAKIIKTIILDAIEIVREDGTDLANAIIKVVSKSEYLDPTVKMYLSMLDAATIQQIISSIPSKDLIAEELDVALAELGDSYFQFDVIFTEDGLQIGYEMSIDVGQDDIQSVKIVLSVVLSAKDVDDVQAPSKLLTMEEVKSVEIQG